MTAARVALALLGTGLLALPAAATGTLAGALASSPQPHGATAEP